MKKKENEKVRRSRNYKLQMAPYFGGILIIIKKH